MDGHIKYISEAIVEGGADKAQGRYLTMTRDGHLLFWQRDLTLHRSVAVSGRGWRRGERACELHLFIATVLVG